MSITLPNSLINHTKNIINQKNNYPCDTKQIVLNIEINNGWNTHIGKIFREECDR